MGSGASAQQQLDLGTFQEAFGPHFSKALFKKLSDDNNLVSADTALQFASSCTDVFLSHDGCENSIRHVSLLNDALQKRGIKTYFENRDKGEEKMHDEDRLDGAAVVICFVTDCYLKKVAGNGPAGEKDKCLFEYEHVVRTKGASKMIVVINDKQCSNTDNWFGPVAELASATYYDYSKDDLLEPVAGQIHTRILSILDKVTVTDRLKRVGVLQDSGSSGGSGSAVTGVGVGAAAEATELEDAEAAVVKKEASDTAEALRASLEAQDLEDLEAGKAEVESQK